jgi:hypothetical protein
MIRVTHVDVMLKSRLRNDQVLTNLVEKLVMRDLELGQGPLLCATTGPVSVQLSLCAIIQYHAVLECLRHV